MSLPLPPPQYSASEEAQTRSQIQQRLDEKLNRFGDVELQKDQRLIMQSPDGNRWSISVNDLGMVTATAA